MSFIKSWDQELRPPPGGGWNDDVDPPNFNQLKLGLWQPLPQFYDEFCSAQAPSSTQIPFCQGFLHFGVGETQLCERSLVFFILAASNNKSLLPISGLVVYFSKPSFCIMYSLLHSWPASQKHVEGHGFRLSLTHTQEELVLSLPKSQETTPWKETSVFLEHHCDQEAEYWRC